MDQSSDNFLHDAMMAELDPGQPRADAKAVFDFSVRVRQRPRLMMSKTPAEPGDHGGTRLSHWDKSKFRCNRLTGAIRFAIVRIYRSIRGMRYQSTDQWEV